MKEVINEVKTFEIRAYCDECGEELKNDGRAYATAPYSYPYFCKNGHKEVSTKVYPHLKHEYIK